MTYKQLFDWTRNKYKVTTSNTIYCLIDTVTKNNFNANKFVDLFNEEIDFDLQKYKFNCQRYFVNNEPIGHIRQSTIFFNIPFIIYKKTFIPRVESEEIIELCLKNMKISKVYNVLDLCCGSGALGISLYKSFKGKIKLDLVDNNKQAINCTKMNLKLHHIKANAILKEGISYLKKLKKKYDIIICNPPYVNKEQHNKLLNKFEYKQSFIDENYPMNFLDFLRNNKRKIVSPLGFIVCETTLGKIVLIKN